jgi:hypothetical protein
MALLTMCCFYANLLICVFVAVYCRHLYCAYGTHSTLSLIRAMIVSPMPHQLCLCRRCRLVCNDSMPSTYTVSSAHTAQQHTIIHFVFQFTLVPISESLPSSACCVLVCMHLQMHASQSMRLAACAYMWLSSCRHTQKKSSLAPNHSRLHADIDAQPPT